MAFDKLHKSLLKALPEANISEPNVVQITALSKLNSGTDIVLSSGSATGKTTAILMSIITKLKYAFEDAPRAMIIVPDKEKAEQTQELFKQLARYTDLRCVIVHDHAPLLKHFEDVYYGTDVLVGTAKRIMDIYFKYNLNINKLKHVVIDNAEHIIKQSLQGHMDRLSQSLPKCQRIIACENFDAKLERVADKLLINPQFIEIEE
jgi:ATP-dependent RNA helicase RhlE